MAKKRFKEATVGDIIAKYATRSIDPEIQVALFKDVLDLIGNKKMKKGLSTSNILARLRYNAAPQILSKTKEREG